MNRNPYIKQCLLQPHIRISLEHWWIGMYGEEVMEKMKKDHLPKWKKDPKEQVIDDLQGMMEKIGTFNFE
jgi:hypothetical protein